MQTYVHMYINGHIYLSSVICNDVTILGNGPIIYSTYAQSGLHWNGQHLILGKVNEKSRGETGKGVMHYGLFDDNSAATDSYGIIGAKWTLGDSNGGISHASTQKHRPRQRKLVNIVLLLCDDFMPG